MRKISPYTQVPPREIRMLLAYLSDNDAYLHSLDIDFNALPNTLQQKLALLIQRRKAGEPIAKIIGKKAFWKNDFYTNQHTLDPRPDSETLIELALELFPNPAESFSILDLGTGTGCLLFSLLCEYTDAYGIGVDKSIEALNVAARNQKALGMQSRSTLLCGDWASALHTPYDLIICNPPYIAHSEQLDTQTLHDPHSALFAGDDGFSDYHILLKTLGSLTKGVVIFELGKGQYAQFKDLAQQYGWQIHALKKDINGIIRAVSVLPNNINTSLK